MWGYVNVSQGGKIGQGWSNRIERMKVIKATREMRVDRGERVLISKPNVNWLVLCPPLCPHHDLLSLFSPTLPVFPTVSPKHFYDQEADSGIDTFLLPEKPAISHRINCVLESLDRANALCQSARQTQQCMQRANSPNMCLVGRKTKKLPRSIGYCYQTVSTVHRISIYIW